MRNLRRALPAVVAVLLETGCVTSRPAPAIAPLDLELTAADRLNPDESGNSLVTAIVVYQLRSAAKLEAADSQQLYRRPKETLGPDLLGSDEITLEPGQKLRRRLDVDRTAKAIAVVAQFRRPTGTSWRAIADLPSSKRPIAFFLEGYRVERR